MRGYTLTQSADRVRIIPRASTSVKPQQNPGYELSSHDRDRSFLPVFPFPSITSSLFPPPPLAGRPLIPCWQHLCHPFSTNTFVRKQSATQQISPSAPNALFPHNNVPLRFSQSPFLPSRPPPAYRACCQRRRMAQSIHIPVRCLGYSSFYSRAAFDAFFCNF